MNASKNKIADIFNGSRCLDIPFFQRSYVWGKDQWQRFFEDMVHISTSEKPYFFGSLIYKQQDTRTDAGVGDVRTVIDGQQRLTTLILFFKTLSFLKEDSSIFDWFLLRKGGIALRHNLNDVDAFEKIVSAENPADIDCADAKHNRIIGAYQFFMKELENYLDDIDEDEIIKYAVFVVVDLSNEDDEQQIFDTLNSLGKPLTTAELLKNFFFREKDIELYNTHWRDVFEKDDETREYWDRSVHAGQDGRTFIDLFFFAFLQIKVQGDPRADAHREEFSRLKNLFSSYKKFVNICKIDTKQFLDEMKKYADSFRIHFDNEVVDEELSAHPNMQRINATIFGLETHTLIPYILFVVNQVKEEAAQQELFGCVEAFVLRRLVVRASNRGYNQLFLRMIAENVLTKEDFYAFFQERKDTTNAMPTDAALGDGFRNSKLTNKNAKGILYFIESRIRSDKHSTALLGMNKYSLEHLMPQNWGKNWKLPSGKDADKRDQILLTLGNLAIVTQKLNASIRDADWAIKKSGNKDNGGLDKFAFSIEIHEGFLSEQTWDEGKIEARAKYLLEKALKIWAVE